MRRDKSIIAMFIVASLTLVVSLAVTLGVLLTAAAPTRFEGLTVYGYNFNGQAITGSDKLVVTQGSTNSLAMQNGVDFKPVSSLNVLNDELGIEAYISVGGANVTDAVELVEGANAKDVLLLPIQIMNNNSLKSFTIRLNATGDETLKDVTYYSVYNYKTTQFLMNADKGTSFKMNTDYKFNDENSNDLLIVVYADASTGMGTIQSVNFPNVALNIKVQVDAYTTIQKL